MDFCRNFPRLHMGISFGGADDRDLTISGDNERSNSLGGAKVLALTKINTSLVREIKRWGRTQHHKFTKHNLLRLQLGFIFL